MKSSKLPGVRRHGFDDLVCVVEANPADGLGKFKKLGSTGSAGIDADCLFSWVLVEVKERKKLL